MTSLKSIFLFLVLALSEAMAMVNPAHSANGFLFSDECAYISFSLVANVCQSCRRGKCRSLEGSMCGRVPSMEAVMDDQCLLVEFSWPCRVSLIK